MLTAPKFYRCARCGRIVGEIKGGGEMTCCGEPMTEITANTVEAAVEKHIPVATLKGCTLNVNVGSVDHPMTPEHFIEWITVYQNGLTQRLQLTPDCKPFGTFTVDPGAPYEVLAYCNLHGLWKA